MEAPPGWRRGRRSASYQVQLYSQPRDLHPLVTADADSIQRRKAVVPLVLQHLPHLFK